MQCTTPPTHWHPILKRKSKWGLKPFETKMIHSI
jgi:hypothetical protein